VTHQGQYPLVIRPSAVTNWRSSEDAGWQFCSDCTYFPSSHYRTSACHAGIRL